MSKANCDVCIILFLRTSLSCQKTRGSSTYMCDIHLPHELFQSEGVVRIQDCARENSVPKVGKFKIRQVRRSHWSVHLAIGQNSRTLKEFDFFWFKRVHVCRERKKNCHMPGPFGGPLGQARIWCWGQKCWQRKLGIKKNSFIQSYKRSAKLNRKGKPGGRQVFFLNSHSQFFFIKKKTTLLIRLTARMYAFSLCSYFFRHRNLHKSFFFLIN